MKLQVKGDQKVIGVTFVDASVREIGVSEYINKSMSLFGLLNTCNIALGTRLLTQRLKQPLLHLAAIEQRQILVDAFVLGTEVRQTLLLRMRPQVQTLAIAEVAFREVVIVGVFHHAIQYPHAIEIEVVSTGKVT